MSGDHASYGRSLPDQVDRIATLFDTHLVIVNDVRELHRERAALEREYAGKLQALAKKAMDKKNKMELSFIIGDEPSKAWTEQVVNQSTLNNAYNKIIKSTNDVAQDHIDLAETVTTQVVEVLKVLERKNEDLKKKQVQFFQKLLADRDRVYADRAKSKQKYDEECLEVSTLRQKQGRVRDDRHADRAAKQYDQQRNDMYNSKNVYLISIAIANRTKAKFYDEDLPLVENTFQILQSHLVKRLTAILLQAQAMQKAQLDVMKGRLNAVELSLMDIDPSMDQSLFIDHNIRPFTAPADWSFEPCVTHYDTGDMNVDPMPKVFLQNKLSRCRTKLQELDPLLDAKRKEMARSFRGFDDRAPGQFRIDTDEIPDAFLETQHQLTLYGVSACVLDAEVQTITAALRGDEGAQRPHSFKSTSFSIPANCGYCKSSIWGLTKQGKTCKLCGMSVHSKCELKVPAECTGATEIRASSTSRIERRQSSKAPEFPTPSSFVRAPSQDEEETRSVARVLFDYAATSKFELSVPQGTFIEILEAEDASGWVKVSDQSGRKGLVPGSYIQVVDDTDIELPVAGSQGRYVRGIYDYEAQGLDELSIRKGERIELIADPLGRQEYGDGWWEGVNSFGQKGIFPSNYVELT